MTKAQQNQRSSRRVPAQGPVTVKVLDGVAQDSSAQLRDVSMRGVFIFLAKKVRLGSTLELVLPLPEGLRTGDQTWIRCKCRVVRVE
jgi:PilZ domain